MSASESASGVCHVLKDIFLYPSRGYINLGNIFEPIKYIYSDSASTKGVDLAIICVLQIKRL